MKSLESIVASKADAHITLITLLPDRIERLRFQTMEVLGINGFLYKDLRDSLVRDGHCFTSTNLKSAIRACGFRSATFVVPHSNGQRVRVYTVDPGNSGRGR